MVGLTKIIIELFLALSIFSTSALMKTDLYIKEPESIPMMKNIDIRERQSSFNTSNIFKQNHDVDPTLKIQYIAVGNGESILIKASGRTMLIDGGENLYEDSFLEYLKEYRIEKIDYLVITSPVDTNTRCIR